MKKVNIKSLILLFIVGAFHFFHPSVSYGNDLFRRTGSLNPLPGCSTTTAENDETLVSRLLKAYQKSDNEMNRGDSMWQFIFNQNHTEIHQIFKNGPFDSATAILRNPAATDLFYGIDGLSKTLLLQFQNPLAPAANAAHCLDGLMRFAEAIGAMRLDNPEGYYQAPIPYDAETVLGIVEKFLNISLSVPNPYPYEYGVATSKGIISQRVPQALYQAWKIKRLLQNVKNPRVLEIGAGLGRTAYYASVFGIKDYTIVDLPFTAICSGYFLGRTMGEDHIVLHGESLDGSKEKIKILTPDDFLQSNNHYDLIINVDSMTEMDPTVARMYLQKIETSTPVFLSINHEINPFSVAELIKERESVLEVSRDPYWLREGYVEEIVRFK